MTYCNILVAVDTTDSVDEILSSVKEMMVDDTATISIVNVIKPITGFYVDRYSALGDSSAIQLEAAEQATIWLAKLTSRHGINADRVEVIIGTPAVRFPRNKSQHHLCDFDKGFLMRRPHVTGNFFVRHLARMFQTGTDCMKTLFGAEFQTGVK